MYKSPIELLVTNVYDQIQKEQDEHIYQAILHYIPNVDKKELIRALQYDRNQYEKGYADGKADAMDELVRCKDCLHWDAETCFCDELSKYYDHGFDWYTFDADDYCSIGERKDNE